VTAQLNSKQEMNLSDDYLSNMVTQGINGANKVG
jgi:hypothetical protein